MKPQSLKEPLKENLCLIVSFKRFYSLLLFLFLTLFSFFPLLAQPLSSYKNGRVITFSENNQYWLMMQDRQGFLWGYNKEFEPVRFDGNRYKVFTYNPNDTSSIEGSPSSPPVLLENRDGKIWVQTGLSLDLYDPVTGKFEHFHKKIVAVDSLGAHSYNSLLEDKDGNIWIGGQRRMYVLSNKDQKIYSHKKTQHIWFLLEDQEGDIWYWRGFSIGTQTIRKADLEKLEPTGMVIWPKKGEYLNDRSYNVLPILNIEDRYQAISIENSKYIQVILVGGELYTFNISTNEIKKHADGLGIGEAISTIFQEGKTILVGTSEQRILRFDVNTEKFSPFLDLEKNITESDPPKYIFKSRDGILWIITNHKTYQVLPLKSNFKEIVFPENIRKTNAPARHDNLVSFKGVTYFNTEQGLVPVVDDGINKTIKLEFSDADFQVPEWRRPKNRKVAYKKFSGFIFVEDTSNQTLWMLLYQFPFGMKIFQFDDEGKKLYELYCDGRDSLCFDDHFLDMKIDENGNLWLAGWAGLSKFNPNTKRFKNWRWSKKKKNTINGRSTVSILIDSRKQVWVGYHNKGVSRFDPFSEKFTHYIYNPSDTGSIGSNQSLRSIIEDDAGDVWFASKGGLSIWSYKTESFTRYSKENGLPSNQNLSLIKDVNNDIWIASPDKLSKYDRVANRFFLFGEEDGIYNYDFTLYGFFTDDNENLYIQTKNNSVLYFQAKTILDTVVPELILTDLLLFNEKVKVNGKDAILTQNMGYTDRIELESDQNIITIQFSPFQYLFPEKISYAYQLKGFNDEWQSNGNKKEVTFTNLNPGTYFLNLKCFNRHGFESKNPLMLEITILPSWYNTWWARSLWAAIVLGLLFWFYRFQLNRKLEQVEAVRLKEMDYLKTQLYTNITHEFRTPLTIILGMTEQVMNNPKDWFLEGLSLIRRNGRQLLHLVNQMLDLTKLESGSLQLNIIQSDIIYYLKYIVESFHSYAESKGIQLHFLADEDQLFMDYDQTKMLHILSNLLSNAIKYTKEDGNIYVSINRRSKNGIFENSQNDPFYFVLSIKDTGIGISPDELPHIFDRFYQADTSDSRRAEGTGIGLALTKEMVKLLGGTIEVKSQLGKGSIFTVTLPIRQEAQQSKLPDERDIEAGVLPFAEQVVRKDVGNPESIAAVNLPLVLIIEDNSDVVQYIASCLQSNYQLVNASNGTTGIEKAIQLVPDIIISDIMMPGKDGFEVCKTLKNDERTGHIPIVLLTAKADMESKIAGLRTGADVYLSKPFNPEELQVRLENLIEQRKKLQKSYQKVLQGSIVKEKRLEFEDVFLEKMRLLVEKNLADVNFDIKAFARKAGISRVQLFRKIKAITDKSPSIFVRTIRLQKAKSLLILTDLHISEIAYDVGFNDPAFFSRTFKDEYGMTPSEFREEQCN